MIKLYALPGAASLAPHILLNEIGVPFELQLADRDAGEHKSPAYLALNPDGLIPVLVDGDLVLYETVAICLHLADTHPSARLAPALCTAERAQYCKWMVWLTNTMQALLIHYFYPERMVCRWTRNFADGPAREHTQIAPYLRRMLARPAVQRAFATEGRRPPLV